MTRDNNPNRLDDGARAKTEMKERAAVSGPELDGYTQYRRKQIAELRPYQMGDSMDGVSISAPDKEAGSPKLGDMIARNPKNHDDKWLVAAAYFADNFEPALPAPQGDEGLVKRLMARASFFDDLREWDAPSGALEREAASALRAKAAEIARLTERIRHLEIDCRQWSADYDERGNTLSAPAGRGVDGLSEWEGWDRSRGDWSASKHKDAVLWALFDGAWSIEDAAALIGFIDRTWTKRPAAPTEGK